MHPGDIVLIEPRQIHEYHCVGKACTFLCLQVSEELFPSLRGMHPESMFPRGIIPKDLYTRLKKQLLDIIRAYSQQEPQYELYCIGMTGLVMHTLMTQIPCRRMTPAFPITAISRKPFRKGPGKPLKPTGKYCGPAVTAII